MKHHSHARPATRRLTSVVVVTAVVVALLAACGASSLRARTGVDAPDRPAAAAPTADDRPNVVFVLMDDASLDLVQTLRSARYMARHGATYQNAFVVDSLCCPSRAATLTGQYPHQNRVFTNIANLPNERGPMGGVQAFDAHGNQERSFAVSLQESGYTTGIVGKYLNGLGADIKDKPDGARVSTVPPGWSEFRPLVGTAYDGWDFEALEPATDGTYRVRRYDAPERTAPRAERDRMYAGTVTQRLALGFIRDHEDDPNPYFLYVGTYAPHIRGEDDPAYADEPLYPPAFRDQPSRLHPDGNCGLVDCLDLTVADLPGFRDQRLDNRPSRADGRLSPRWQPKPKWVVASQAESELRDRAQMVQSVDRMVMRILRGVDDDTIVVLTSDNGYHIGQYGQTRGKGLPYDSDINVPLLVVGPGVEQGLREAPVTNIDWASTFEELAGVRSPTYRSGRSIVPTFADPAAGVHDYAFVEHTWSRSRPGVDPDRAYNGGGLNAIPSYVAVRSRTALLVRFDLDRRWGHADFVYEFYDYRSQPWARTNQFGDPEHAAEVSTLMEKLEQWDECHGVRESDPVTATCRTLTQAHR